jgi:hypothetical protein
MSGFEFDEISETITVVGDSFRGPAIKTIKKYYIDDQEISYGELKILQSLNYITNELEALKTQSKDIKEVVDTIWRNT